MKKLFALLALFVSALAVTEAQVRSQVAIVRPVLHDSTRSFILDLASSMSDEGYKDASEYLKAWAEGGFGSGFVWVDPADGANYVITNRHVVAQARSVTLEFEMDDLSSSVYRDCPIISMSESLDLALIGFPSGARPFKASMALASTPPADGTDVWSAGFPGLMSRPLWQFGKGSVTNSRARVPELSEQFPVELIQHSAPIDPGSSGGPLLVADRSGPSGYAVAGINTWKVGDRQDVNFAIPSALIAKFLSESLEPADTDARSELGERARSMAASVNAAEDAYKKAARFISYDLVSRIGESCLKDALASAPTRIRDAIIATFVGVSPIDGLRLATAWAIAEASAGAGPDPLSFADVESAEDGEGSVNMTMGGASFRTSWILEHGYWRLASFPLHASQAADADDAVKTGSAFAISSPYDFGFLAGAVVELGGDGLVLGSLGVTGILFSSDLFTWSVEASGGAFDTVDTWTGDTGRMAIVVMRAGVTLQLPLFLGDIYLAPYARATAGLGLPLGLAGSSFAGGVATLGGGLALTFRESSITVSLEYQHMSRAPMDFAAGEKPSDELIAAYLTFGMY